MNKAEDRRLTVILGIFVALIIFTVVVSINNAVAFSQKQKAEMAKYNEFKESSEKQLLYLGRTGCSFCELLDPIIADFEDSYDLEYVYLNAEYLSNDQLNTIIDEMGVSSEAFGTPYLAFVQDGKKLDEQIGFLGEEKFFNFIKENGAIDADSELVLTYLDYDKFNEVLKSDKNEVIILGQTTCTYCQQARPILQEIVKEEDITIYYYEINTIEDATEKAAVSNFATKVLGTSWGTPAIIIVKNGEKVASLVGAQTKENYLKILKDNGIVE